MDRGVLAARRQTAIEKIEKKTGIDISRNAMPKAQSVELFQLFQLEALAREIKEPEENTAPQNVDEILKTIKNIKGVGPALFDKIDEAVTHLGN